MMFLHQIQRSFSPHLSPNTAEPYSHYPQQSLHITITTNSATNHLTKANKITEMKHKAHTFTARNLEQPFNDLPIDKAVIYSKNMEFLSTAGRTNTTQFLNSHFSLVGFSANTTSASNVSSRNERSLIRQIPPQLCRK